MVEEMTVLSRTLTAFLVMILVTAGAMGLFLQTGATNDPGSGGGLVTGNWTVLDSRSYSGVDIVVEGNITVMPGGVLTIIGGTLNVTGNFTVLGGGGVTLENVDVVMNSSLGKEYRITVAGDLVNGTARMNVTDGTTFDNNRTTDKPYYFSVTGLSRFRMDHAIIRHMGNLSLVSGGSGTDLLASVQKLGLFIGTSDVVVSDTLFSNCSGGPIVSELNMFATGHLTPTLVNNTFEDCYLGIVSGFRATPTLDNNTYRRASVGLYVLLPVLSGIETVAIKKNTFLDCAVGIWGMGAPIKVTNTDILRPTMVGIISNSARLFIITYRASILMDNSSVRDGTNGTLLNATTFWAFDSIISGHSQSGFQLGNSSSAELLNTSYDRSKVVIEDSASSFNASWFLKLGTKNESGTPLVSSSVVIVDGQGAQVSDLTTGADGWAPERVMKEVNIRRDGPINYTPHNVTALSSGGDLRNITKVNMSASMQVMLTLAAFDDTPPMVSISSPKNGSFVTEHLVNVSGAAYDNKGLKFVQVSFDRGTTWTNATGTTSWYVNVDVGMDGPYNVTARAIDLWDHNATDQIDIIVDATPPVLTILAPVNGTFVATTWVNVTVNTSASEVTIADVVVKTGADGNATRTVEVSSEGSRVIEAWAKDEAGNRAEACVTVIVDLTPPAITVDAQPNYDVADISVNGTVSDQLSGVDRLEKSLGGTNWTDVSFSDKGDGTLVFSTVFVLLVGDNTLYMRALDKAGNQAIKPVPVTYVPPDVSSPTVNITSPLDGSVIDNMAFEVRGSAYDERGIVSVEWSVGAGPWSPLDMTSVQTMPGTVLWNGTVTMNARGQNTISVRAFDAAGNNGTASITLMVTGDLTPPVVTFTYPAPNANLAEELVDVKGTALDDVGVIYVLVCANDPTFELNATNTTVDANGEWHATVKLVKGFNTIYVRAYDAAGRSTSSELRVFSEPEEKDGDKTEMKNPWWLPFATLAFILLLIMAVIFGLWAKSNKNKEKDEEGANGKGEGEDYEPMMMQRSKGGRKVEVERMVQQQEVEKAEIRKKAIDRKKKKGDGEEGHGHGSSDIPPPKETWRVEKSTKELHVSDEEGPEDEKGKM